jgi:capsular polysaccharide biosynthesis protein
MEIGLVSPAALASGERPYICASCTAQGQSLLDIVGLPRLVMSELVDEAIRKSIRMRAATLTVEQIKCLTDDGVDAGEHAIAGALRFFARGDLSGEPHGEGVLRRYAEGAMMAAAAIEQAVARNHYDVVIAHHGIYVPQCIVNEVCRRRGVRLVAWNPAYRRHCFIFSHADTYHRTMIAEPNAAWETIAWSPKLERDTLDYLDSRWDGSEDWIRFHTDPQHDMATIADEIELDASKPVVTLLTNVVWDAQLHYPSNAFPSMLDWVFDTIRYFAGRPELQLIIRVHPAELTGFMPSRQHMADEVVRTFPNLPNNVRIVAPSSNVSTYTLCENSDAVLIYNTKAGIEVTAKGIPTVVAGDAWIRNKGFCESPTTAAEYFAVLDRLPFGQRMDDTQRKRALLYAYHLFFRRMIPLPFIEARERGRLSLKLDTLDDLAPGRYLGLDVICDGILGGTPFIYPAESLNGATTAQQRSAVA